MNNPPFAIRRGWNYYIKGVVLLDDDVVIAEGEENLNYNMIRELMENYGEAELTAQSYQSANIA